MISVAGAGCEIRPEGGLDLLAWPEFDQVGALIRVTTRGGGVSGGPYESLNLSFSVGDDPGSVRENRRRVAAAVGAGLDEFVFARQVHSGRPVVVTAADRGRGALSPEDAVPDADALVTADPAVVLAIGVGDCVPVVLCDPAAGVLACVHAGWRGTVARITETTLEAMTGLGARRERVLAGIGPAIGPTGTRSGTMWPGRSGPASGTGPRTASCGRTGPGGSCSTCGTPTRSCWPTRASLSSRSTSRTSRPGREGMAALAGSSAIGRPARAVGSRWWPGS